MLGGNQVSSSSSTPGLAHEPLHLESAGRGPVLPSRWPVSSALVEVQLLMFSLTASLLAGESRQQIRLGERKEKKAAFAYQ